MIYHGRVQGVGFRGTACAIASDFHVSGYVRNLEDGTVELETQGRADQVDSFLKALREKMGSNIQRETVIERPPQNGEPAFEWL